MKATVLAALLLAGCATVEVISGAPPVGDSNCQIRVYQTQAQALKGGPIDELCIITGTSSMSFVHTVATAIEKHKDKACACGARDVYIQSRMQDGWNLASVTMIAFRYAPKK